MLSHPVILLAQFSTSGTEICMTGVCTAIEPWRSVPSGIFFIAVGLVGLGIFGLRRRPPV